MKAKRTILLGVVVWAWVGLLTGSTPTIAQPKPPQGELKIADVTFGTQVPVPHLEMGSNAEYLRLLYDPLVGSFPDGRLSPEHGVANKWEMSPDGLRWTFYIRKGVKFHDGVELTAKDVKFSIEQVMRPNSKADARIEFRHLIKIVELKDLHTVVVHMKTPSLMLPSLFSDAKGIEALVQPKEAYEKLGEEQFISHPIGSGPYKWHSQMIGSFVKLEATDKHWRDGVPRYKYVTYLIIPEESTQIAMLKTGQADIIRIGRDRVEEFLKAGFNVISKPNAATVIFYCNMQWTSPVFSDIKFRKALNLAINREEIIKHLFAGLAKPVATFPGNLILECGGDRALRPYPYDPGEARRLIKEGGYEGHEFTVASYPRPGCPEFQRLVEAVCGYWQKVGLKPKIFMTDWTTWRERWRAQKNAGTISGQNSSVEAGCLLLLNRMKRDFYSTSDGTVCKDQKLDEMFDRALGSLDMGEVSKLLRDIHRYVYDQHFMVSICDLNDEIATSKGIPKWDPGLRRNHRNYSDLIKQ